MSGNHKHAIDNAAAWLGNIREMVAAVGAAEDADDDRAADEARERIQESVLSVEVRDGWRVPGLSNNDGPEEYSILLTTGGPALRIVGELDACQPENARLEWQDWGTPWTAYQGMSEADREALMSFVSHFYFGE